MIGSMENSIESSIEQLKHGFPILIFDDVKREGETDLVFASQFVTPSAIKMLRKDAGGLICTTLREEDAKVINLPFLEDLYKRFLPYGKIATDTKDLRYDSHSSFSFTMNHRKTYTGIPDNDRSLTITEFAKFIENISKKKDVLEDFYREFRIPGHVHLIVAREKYFKNRQGHTELSTYLMEKAGLVPSATLAEMLSDDGDAMSREEAIKFAADHKLTFIDGKEIIDLWTND
jgi:3,4-dihydroxy 2-butanone 4-phosphate synthase